MPKTYSNVLMKRESRYQRKLAKQTPKSNQEVVTPLSIPDYTRSSMGKVLFSLLLLNAVVTMAEPAPTAAKSRSEKVKSRPIQAEISASPPDQFPTFTSTMTAGIVTSPSTVLLHPLRFNNSRSYSFFEQDRQKTQAMIEELYPKNRMFKCKLDAVSKNQKLIFEFVPKGTFDENTMGQFSIQDQHLRLPRGIKKSDQAKATILHETEHAFTSNDNRVQKKLNHQGIYQAHPFGPTLKEYNAFKTAVADDLANIETYLNWLKPSAKLSKQQQAQVDRFKKVVKDYQPLVHRPIHFVDQAFVNKKLKEGVLNKKLQCVRPEKLGTMQGISMYLHHLKKQANGQYQVYVRTVETPGGDIVKASLYDALYILKLEVPQRYQGKEDHMLIETAACAQQFGIYPGLTEMLIPAISKHEEDHRHPSYKACLRGP